MNRRGFFKAMVAAAACAAVPWHGARERWGHGIAWKVWHTQAELNSQWRAATEREMLKNAMPVVILDKFGKLRPIPKSKTPTIAFRRPKVFTGAA